ncbi:dipeptide epimerase [Mitsuaria sp. GD03876]|uniref:dipeptide epimerase n=1 Tax=Mitsuaria sp. GD03876 TaxID=2975399 RepID=UPI00244A4C6F|nr:dipeptide epimerase [Mitsuaria sp. GD03876]MDH0865236.1 dipeptide epimerase [Mitsuaria sp. GD03876]
MPRFQLSFHVESLALREPFVISGYRFTEMPTLRVSLREGPNEGRGEAAGVYYLQDRPADMPARLEAVRDVIEAGIDRAALRQLLPPGGARNALDCALWELEALRRDQPVWALAGGSPPRPLTTTFTLGAGDPGAMADAAKAFGVARALKLKLTGETEADIARVRAVRAARPDAWIGVDANQGFTPATIEPLLPVLVACDVSLVEQPFARGREADMDLVDFPMPTAADESCLHLDELETLGGRFDLLNIKLDKCGGLTEGLLMARRARELGLGVMVGNMGGTSLAMAPAMVLAQRCDVVDLDGPTILVRDCVPGVRYAAGTIDCPVEVWGGTGSA